MSFFNNIESENLAARITNRGRRKIAQGNFNISYFQVGDSEFDYNFKELNGSSSSIPAQKVFVPLDNDDTVKYPYKLTTSSETGTTFGTPIESYETTILKNEMGAAGFVSAYTTTGSSVGCCYDEIDIIELSGTTELRLSTGFTTNSEYITIAYSELTGADPDAPLITSESNSLVYKVMSGATGTTYNTFTLDRKTPDLSSFTGKATVIRNDCDPFFDGTSTLPDDCLPTRQNPGDRQDPWTLNIVWGEKPAGMDSPTEVDEDLSGYTSNVYVSTKEFLGYTSSDGQLYNTGTTITNSFGENIVTLPEEQHSLAIVHYSEPNTVRDPDKFFKYEDYIAHKDTDDIDYFEVYIPYILYHRNSGSTVGARFFMDTTNYYIDSAASDTKLNKIKYRYLIDEQNVKVGKVFVNHKTIVFDDQEIVAALDYKSNRKHTLPIPRVAQVPVDMKCVTNDGGPTTPLMAASTGETMFISYLFVMTGNTGMTGLHCNQYSKVTGTSLNADVSVNFSSTDFIYMTNNLSSYKTGYIADKFYILAQLVTTGNQPTPDDWKIMDFTDEIPNHTVGDYIDPSNMQGARFIVTYDDYDNASNYDIEDYLGLFPDEPSTSPQFGDEQPFPGSITLVRAIDIYTMRFLINLPQGQFETTQNPTYPEERITKRITEVALLDSNKDVLAIAKSSKPIARTGNQVLAVKIDF